MEHPFLKPGQGLSLLTGEDAPYQWELIDGEQGYWERRKRGDARPACAMGCDGRRSPRSLGTAFFGWFSKIKPCIFKNVFEKAGIYRTFYGEF